MELPRIYTDENGEEYQMDIPITFGNEGSQWCSHEDTTLVWHGQAFNEFDHVMVKDEYGGTFYIFGNPDFEQILGNNGFPRLVSLMPTQETMERYSRYLDSVMGVLEHEIYKEIDNK
jgi:hypothetical protein